MLAPSKPRSRKSLRAPSRICRRFELSSSATRESVARVDAGICSAVFPRQAPAETLLEGAVSHASLRWIYLDRTVRSMIIDEWRLARLARALRHVAQSTSGSVMAAARDQAARIVRSEPDADER